MLERESPVDRSSVSYGSLGDHQQRGNDFLSHVASKSAIGSENGSTAFYRPQQQTNGGQRTSAFTPLQNIGNGRAQEGGLYEENDLTPLIQQLLTLQASNGKQGEKKTNGFWNLNGDSEWKKNGVDNFNNTSTQFGNGYGANGTDASLAGSMLPVWSHQKGEFDERRQEQSPESDQWWSGYEAATNRKVSSSSENYQCYNGRPLQVGTPEYRSSNGSSLAVGSGTSSLRGRSQSNQFNTMGQSESGSSNDARLFVYANGGASGLYQQNEIGGQKSPPTQAYTGGSLLTTKMNPTDLANYGTNGKLNGAAAAFSQLRQPINSMPTEELMELLARARNLQLGAAAAAWPPGAFAPFGWEFLPHPFFGGVPTHGWMGARFVR